MLDIVGERERGYYIDIDVTLMTFKKLTFEPGDYV